MKGRKLVFDSSEGMVLEIGGRKLESGLLGAVTLAYAGRYCLHLRPDDIWLAISQGVSAHLQADKNAEKYRKTFVEHKGKKDIPVDVTALLTGKSDFFSIETLLNVFDVSPFLQFE